MIWPGYEGPREQWQQELESLTRDGLFAFVMLQVSVRRALRGLIPQDLLEDVRAAKAAGKHIAAGREFLRYQADPDKFIDEKIRRAKAAKKASRRRKRNAR